MGTRSLTRVYDESDKLVLFLYRQMDGYPSGHGADLHKALGKIKLVNGLGQQETNIANGMGCFAAQLVAALKNEPGGFYLQAPTEKFGWAEYVYDFRPNLPGHPGWSNDQKDERHLMLKVSTNYGDPKVLYDGSFADFDPTTAEKAANPEEE